MNKKKIIIIISAIITVLILATVVVIFLPGRIKKTDKGMKYTRFGVEAKEKWVTKNKEKYYFDKNGYAYTGWNDIDEATYYFSKEGIMQKGWLELDGNRYYLSKKDGKLQKGFSVVDSDNYYFNEDDGSLQTGVVKKDDRIIAYSEEDGKLKSGIYELEGALRCFSESGESKEGWVNIGEDRLYCNADGTAAIGLVTIQDKNYFFNETGILQTGWSQDSNGNRYYAGEDKSLLTGKQEIEGNKYYFAENGVMQTGWINISDSERSYAGEDGILLTGSQNLFGIQFDFDENGILINQNSGEIKMVALTFDDGPSINTDRILDVLEQFNCRATFFVVGSRVSQYSAQLKRSYDLGCEIGSHTFNHKYLTSLSDEEFNSEFNRTDEVISQIIGQSATCVRPPGGFFNDEVKAKISTPIVMWGVDTQDWKSRDAQSVAQIATTNIKDGDIILMHDLYSSTAEAVQTIVPALISQGFQIVTVSELLDAHGGAFGGKVYFSATDIR